MLSGLRAVGSLSTSDPCTLPLRPSFLLSGLRAGSGLLPVAGCAFALRAAALPAVVVEGAVV